jgi:tetratricopeptide (TPR) repeat protein
MMMGATPLHGLSELIHELDIKIDRNPGYADLRNMRGLVLVCRGEPGAAGGDFTAALERNPHYTAALLNRAWAHFERAEPELIGEILAERAGQQLSAQHRGHLKFLEVLGRDGMQAAGELLEQYAPTELPAHQRWLELDRLWIGCRQRRWDLVDAQLERILEWIPDMTTHFRAVGLLQPGSRGRDALALWSQTYRGNPQIAAALRECVMLCSRPDSQGDELLHWGAAISLDLCDYWMSIGTRCELQGRDADSEQAYRRAVDCNPRFAQPYIKLGLLYAACGRPHQAVRELEEATALQPRYPDVRYMLGLLHEDLGQPDDAEAEYCNALGIHPGYTMARLALGCLLDSRRDDEEALKLLEGVRQAGVESADLEHRLAGLYDRTGRPEDAIDARARARELNISEV